MFLIVGLGNPGPKYKNTRHNIGARAVDDIAANFQFPIFNFQSISKGEINGKDVVLAKPQSFMNNSGTAIKSLIKNLKLEIKNLVVIHDDLDLPLGEFKIQKNRGSAGHKGVQSIIDSLGTKDFNRIRIGICPQNGKPNDVEKFVLQNFTKSEEKILKQVIQTITEKISSINLRG